MTDGRARFMPPRPLARWARRLLAAYLVLVVLLMLLERYLVYPAPRYPQGDWTPAALDPVDVYFNSDDGTQLHGWFVAHPAPRAYLLYSHGNGEHVAQLADRLALLRDELQVSVFAFDYRGYGRSVGSPHEQGVLADGRAARAWLAQQSGGSASDLVYMGRSLGGAVSIALAAQQGARGLIVENTFTSLPDVAARFYWWLPVRWLMRNRYPALETIRGYHGPLLISHGGADQLVPIDMGRQLFQAAPGRNKRFLEFPGDDHNDPPPPQYWGEVDQFLEQSARP